MAVGNSFLDEELAQDKASRSSDAAEFLRRFLQANQNVGDLLSLDYDEANVLVHDSLRQHVGGIPLGCFLLASRIDPEGTEPLDPSGEDVSALLFRVVGKGDLPNAAEAEFYRFSAGQRSVDSPEQWDSLGKTDQYTLNILRFAGVRCRVLGTFRMKQDGSGDWELSFGADISNFYSGRGMKVYKPVGNSLAQIVNFRRGIGDDAHPLYGSRVPIARVRYSASEPPSRESSRRGDVRVDLDPTDLVARRTALFGMSRTGKSNTTKIICSSVFELRAKDRARGRIGQLIFDVNGEYANDNPQDKGCLRNIWQRVTRNKAGEVVTYGTHSHPNDPDRRIIKINFFGRDPAGGFTGWTERDKVVNALESMLVGKTLLDDILSQEQRQYIRNFREAHLEPYLELTEGTATRYRRAVMVYRAILAGAGLKPPSSQRRPYIKGLFGKELREALDHGNGDTPTEEQAYKEAAKVLAVERPSWEQFLTALQALRRFISAQGKSGYGEFNRQYMSEHDGEQWHDKMLDGLLSLLDYENGLRALWPAHNLHDPNTKDDYATDVAEQLAEGRLVIVDQSMGDPQYNRAAADRIARAVFERQKQAFIAPSRDDDGNLVPPPDILLYVEEAHNLLPSREDKDLDPIWSRIAKEGSKYRIGMLYATQEPSSLQSNILSNTDNWFVAHLNNTQEVSEVTKFYDFEDFRGPTLKVPEPGFIRMRTLSNPYVVPVQVDRFIAVPGRVEPSA